MSKDLPQPQQSEEVDLGQLFKLIGNAFERLFKFIGSIFNKLFLAFVWLVFFVKKHFVKLVIAGVIGIIYGFISQKTSEPVFKSYITVKQNYDTGENLYNSVYYYNDLVAQEDFGTLASVLGITEVKAKSILEFNIESVITENEKIQNYDNYIKTLDSVVASTINYEQYLKNSKDFTHKYQQVSVKAKERTNFGAVFSRLINGISTNEYFKREQEKDLKELLNREIALQKALNESDSLKSTYKKVLVNDLREDKKGSEIGITFEGTNEKDKTKEYDLYLNDIELRNELVQIERLKEDKEYIIEVISSKQDSGSIDNKKQIFGVKIGPKLFYGISLAFLTFIVLLGYTFFTFLEKFRE